MSDTNTCKFNNIWSYPTAKYNICIPLMFGHILENRQAVALVYKYSSTNNSIPNGQPVCADLSIHFFLHNNSCKLIDQ